MLDPSRMEYRPRRFWDFHVPEGAWNYRARDTKKLWAQPSDFHERARNRVSVPDANLPAPWSCNWRYWPYAAAMFEVLSLRVRALVNITCVVVGVASEAMKKPLQPLRRAPVYPFEGVFPSLDVFIEAADWNRIKRLELAGNANKNLTAISSKCAWIKGKKPVNWDFLLPSFLTTQLETSEVPGE
ncbi:hypothetical protein B0H16DRAFT_1804419 [Mycena metata]|uniref:Uncharacterized protein n=1 Tax=Mycena metata TaxID=1033252 RepID=A0AAD7JFI9_9AGAR|nr:hypothetical protein B0H16DRAFT_1804419 [Mycena metata]